MKQLCDDVKQTVDEAIQNVKDIDQVVTEAVERAVSAKLNR
jgi:Iap family predicted aminopeptidase